MKRFWKHRTNAGRVVYDRRKNPFTWRDILRIIRKAPNWWYRHLDRDPFPWFLLVLIHVVQLIRDLAISPFDFPRDPPPGGEALTNCLDIVDAFLRDWYSIYLEVDPTWEQFGGGDFGGGGATRPVPECPHTRPVGASQFDIGPCGVSWLVMPFQGHCCSDETEEG